MKNQKHYVVDEDPPWLDPRAAVDLRDDADDFEDALIAEREMTRYQSGSPRATYG